MKTLFQIILCVLAMQVTAGPAAPESARCQRCGAGFQRCTDPAAAAAAAPAESGKNDAALLAQCLAQSRAKGARYLLPADWTPSRLLLALARLIEVGRVDAGECFYHWCRGLDPRAMEELQGEIGLCLRALAGNEAVQCGLRRPATVPEAPVGVVFDCVDYLRGVKAARARLLALVARGPWDSARGLVLQCLAACKDPAACGLVLRRFDRERDLAFQEQAALYLAETGQARDLPGLRAAIRQVAEGAPAAAAPEDAAFARFALESALREIQLRGQAAPAAPLNAEAMLNADP